MKILFVSDTYYPHLNGVYYFVCRVAPLLKERGHEVAVIAPSETIHASLKKIDDVDVFGIPSLPVIYYPGVRVAIPFQKKRIRHIIERFHPDVIHVQDHFALGKSTIEVSNLLGIPVIGTNHFMPENLTAFVHSEKWKNKLSGFLWKKFANTYNQLLVVTTPSEWAAELIRPKLSTPVLTISSGIDLMAFRPQGKGAWVKEKFGIPDMPVLLFVGRLDPEKKLEETLRAVEIALRTIDFCFVVVGKGVKKASLEKEAHVLGIENRVIFTGFVTDEELPFLYRLSNCFVISSTAELLSLGTLQAMSSGLPVIAVDAGALGELVKPEVNGYLYKSGDTMALADHICSILGQPELAEQMKLNNSVLVSKHDIHNTILSFEELYETVRQPYLLSRIINSKKTRHKVV